MAALLVVVVVVMLTAAKKVIPRDTHVTDASVVLAWHMRVKRLFKRETSCLSLARRITQHAHATSCVAFAVLGLNPSCATIP